MFGYVVPLRGELKVWELDAYQAAYCGLCHTLGRRYGFLPRLLLSYDFAFLSMLLSTESARPITQRRRCIACPIKGKQVCRESLSLDIAADESVILTYWKLMDGVADASFWKGLPSRLLVLLLRPSYHRAAKRRPDFDSWTAACLEELRFLEKERSGSLDRTADTFARILRAAAPSTGTSDRDRAVGQLLYHVGRWIYLTDAWDDLAEDRSRGTYNPVAARWPDGPEGHREELRTTLRHSLNLAVSACHLTDFGPWSGIVLNILCLGLPMVEESVFRGEWRKRKKGTNGRMSYERSV